MANIVEFFSTNFDKFNMPAISWTDVVEILVIAFLIYEILLWFKKSRAFYLLRGIGVIVLFIVVAEIFEMSTILWIVNKLFTIAATVIVVVFQPELRHALESLGNKNYFGDLNLFDQNRADEGRFSDSTLEGIVNACNAMARARTGALIVIEQTSSLVEIERTGIKLDALLTSELLINIFEHNTPLHDGAVVVRGDRVTYATCYLPLSNDLSLSKELGTRHRAGLGISEVGDSLTIIVSEETGRISIAYKGELMRNVDQSTFRKLLTQVQDKPEPEKKHSRFKSKAKDNKADGRKS